MADMFKICSSITNANKHIMFETIEFYSYFIKIDIFFTLKCLTFDFCLKKPLGHIYQTMK